MFDRLVQVWKKCESVLVFLAEGHCHSFESSLRGLEGTGHRDSDRVPQMVRDRQDFGEVVWAEGPRRVCESRTW